MTKEALKFALEALEDVCGNRCNAEYNPCFQREAITAIKEALAQPWEKFCDSNCVWTDHHPDCKLAQHEQEFNLDYDTQAVLVEEIQRMAKRILELEALLESQTALLEQQTARIVDLQTHIENLEGEE